jgi:hypothetical protein
MEQQFNSFESRLNREPKEQNTSIISAIKKRLIDMLSQGQTQLIEQDDRYEMESCQELSYEQISDWVLKYKPAEADSVLLVNMPNEQKKSKYRILIGVVFISQNQILLNAKYIKKIIYCNSINFDLKELFAGKESVILK